MGRACPRGFRAAQGELPPCLRSDDRATREVAVEPRRVVVELSPGDFEALRVACGSHVSVAQYVRLVALRLHRSAEPRLRRQTRSRLLRRLATGRCTRNDKWGRLLGEAPRTKGG
jgi:hypothetical protein